eukprot:UN00116
MSLVKLTKISIRYGRRLSLRSIVSRRRRFSVAPQPKIAGLGLKRIKLQKGDKIWWCACGYSSDEAICDGTHERKKTGMKPVEFVATRTTQYGLCTCKLSKKGPICDGSHKELLRKAFK